jgi:hypothetical protein
MVMRALKILFLLFVLSVVSGPSAALAQEPGGGSIVWSVAKNVLLDPTTYVPATLSYTSQRMDWNSSQALFKAGWVEHNSRYTVSGRPNDIPLSYEAGNRQIRNDALAHLQESVVNNLSAQVFDRVLTQRYPSHRKLFKTLGWIERISFSGYVGYLASADHFRQVDRNQQMANNSGIQ